ncbi:MAG: hypothetical protein JWO20_2191 [Candidatus Angelobacter sp.]|jgi:hypothetical protein|nr:hypothetical protein [Candidatus Angelobacter sp.]
MRINHMPTLRASGFAQNAVRFAAFLVVFTLLAVPVFAQTSARLDGTIQDQTGAVVPNAKISALNIRTQEQESTTANSQGFFTIPTLTPGTYNVTIEAAGFQKQVIKNLELTVGAIVAQTYKLKVGQAVDTVVVEANAVAVSTTDSSLGSAVNMRDINTLPQLNRGPIALAVFQPGVQISTQNGDVSFSHVNGLRGGSNNTTLDGIDVNDSLVPRLGLTLTSNNTDSVQEFRVTTEGGKSEQGRSAGAQTELVTRSGTNQYHGAAFDYLRNTVMNANDYFNNQATPLIPVPKFIKNIYGGSFGGPIMHDKTFIFGNFQGTRTAQETVRTRTVYTDSARNGIFSFTNAAGGISTYNIVANDPRGKGIDAQMVPILAAIPHGNNFNVGDGLNTQGFSFNNPSGSYEDQFTIRGDHNISKTNKAFLRWSWQRNSAIDALNGADATFPGQPQGTQGGKRWGYSIGDDWSFGSTWSNEFRFGHQSATVSFLRPGRLPGPTIITNLVTDPFNSAFAQGRNSPVNDLTDNVTKVHNNHTFKFGTNIRYTLQTGFNDGGIYPNVTDSATANGNAPPIPAALTAAEVGLTAAQKATVESRFSNLYNDLLGRIDTVTLTFLSTDLKTFQAPGATRQRDFTLKESGYFFQDDWRIRRNLTLNLGLRYEIYGAPIEKNGIQAVLDNNSLIDGVHQFTNLAVTQGSNWYGIDRNNFAPRIGFAWDIFGDGKTALRGNFGTFYDRTIGAAVSQVDALSPGFAGSNATFPNSGGTDVRYSDGIPIPAAPAAPVTLVPVSNRTTSVAIVNPNLRSGYVQSYGLGVQRELAKNTVLEVGYVGNRGIKLFMAQDLNQVRIGGDFLTSFQQLQAFQALPVAQQTAANAPTNTLTKMFPTTGCTATQNPSATAAGCAIVKLGATNISQGLAGTVANTLDRNLNSLYTLAGVPQTYLRNYPQFNQVQVGENSGRSYYDSLQVTVRRSAGALRMVGNYTYSHSIDNITVDPNGFTSPIDNYNPGLNKGSGDFDHRHSFNASMSYTLPFGRGQHFAGNAPRWLDEMIGGWDVGSLIILQDGTLFTVSGQRATFNNDANSRANYRGDVHAGSVQYQPNGSVFFFTPADFANFGFPTSGSIGTSGRNAFRGPHFTNVDASLVKVFKITERQKVSFRAEAYNLFNHPNFGGVTSTTNTNLNSPSTFGKFSSTLGSSGGGTGARTLQLALRFDF